MRRIIAAVVATVCAFALFQGCTTVRMRNSEAGIQAKWERFRSIRPFPYVPVGMVTIDIANKAACDLSQQVCDEVIVPYVELDKEGLISVYAQFVEEVESAMRRSGGMSKEAAVHHVMAEWTRKYGAYNVDKLRRAIPLIRNMQAGNQFTKATARLLPQSLALVGTLRGGIAQIKRESKDAIGIIKMSAATLQLIGRVERLVWAMHFLDVLKKDQAAETRAIGEYIDSFQSREV